MVPVSRLQMVSTGLHSANLPRCSSSRLYGTRNATLLDSVPPAVTTLTVPVVAPVGTVVVISELETTLKVAAVPLKVTLVAPVSLVPRILIAAPTLPEVGNVSTNGPSPRSELETTLKVAAVPLKVTLVAPVSLVPRILIAAPTLPEVGNVSTNGPSP